MANQKTQGISKKTAIIIFALSLFIIILAGIAYRMALPSKQTNMISKATSSDLLYPNASWEEIKFDPNNNELNQIFAVLKNYHSLSITFPNGTLYEGKTPLEYPNVESYYENILLKEDGWSSYEIPFDSFTLQSLIADGPCGGVRGYINYKDATITIISIQHELVSCNLPDSADAMQPQTNQKPLANYSIFISDPKPLKEIETYIKTNSESGF